MVCIDFWNLWFDVWLVFVFVGSRVRVSRLCVRFFLLSLFVFLIFWVFDIFRSWIVLKFSRFLVLFLFIVLCDFIFWFIEIIFFKFMILVMFFWLFFFNILFGIEGMLKYDLLLYIVVSFINFLYGKIIFMKCFYKE